MQTQRQCNVAFSLPSGAGWALSWARYLVCVPFDRRPWIVLDTHTGKMRTTGVTDAVPASVQCDRPYIYLEQLRSLAVLNLRTGTLRKLISSKKAYWIQYGFYPYGRFWSPDYNKMIALSFPKRYGSNTLVMIDKRTGSTREWQLPRGRIRSWTWPGSDLSHPWVLTVGPGMLYRVGDKGNSGRPIAALDDTGVKAAMLSPESDRAIGFDSIKCGVFCVDFRHPDRKLSVMAEDGTDLGRGIVVAWASWSPDGRKVALLFSKKGRDRLFLCAGDPEKSMRFVQPPGDFRFGNVRDLADQPEANATVWDGTGKRIYCVLSTGRRGKGQQSAFALGECTVPE